MSDCTVEKEKKKKFCILAIVCSESTNYRSEECCKWPMVRCQSDWQDTYPHKRRFPFLIPLPLNSRSIASAQMNPFFLFLLKTNGA